MSMNEIEGIYPLSPLQESVFLQDGENPEGAAWCSQLSFRIRGQVDVSDFERAWQQVVSRQPILRTSFVWRRVEQPLQVLNKQLTAALETRDLRAAQRNGHDGESLHGLFQTERERGFNLTRAPLARPLFCVEDENAYQLVFTYHQLILDEFSAASVLREVFGEYLNLRGGPHSSSEEARPFCDYLNWLEQHDASHARAYWRGLLDGFVPTASTGVDRTTSVFPGREGVATQQLSLSHTTTTALQSFAEEHGLAVEVLAQAAWALMLGQYSGGEDVVFGVAVSGRAAGFERGESFIGPLANTLPVRARVSREATLLSLLKALQEQHVKLRGFAHVPLTSVCDWNELPPDVPLFESVFAFGDEPFDPSSWDVNTNFQVGEIRSGGNQRAPLMLKALPGAELTLRLTYDGGRFHRQTIARMLEQLARVLAGMPLHAERRLSEISLLSKDEKHTLLVEWNDSGSDFPRDKSVAELFEAQAAQTPDAIAVRFEDAQLTYGELDRRANRLAHYLRGLGVGPEVPVGVCMERSAEMVVGLLGILKAGGAYVPLDPAYPLERLAFMIEDAQLSILLTQEQMLDNLPAYFGHVVCVDADAAIIARESERNLPCTTAGDSLAYIIYTSGSTGQPKGISIVHRGITRLVLDANYIQLHSTDRIAQASNSSFDAMTFEVWGALLNGACLVGVNTELALSPTEFAAFLSEQGVSVLFLTTALFNQIAHEAPRAFEGLRYLLFGGEAVEPKWVRQVLTQGAPQHLLHVYGPTESTTYATWHLVKDVDEGATTVPIGGPLSNTQLYVLDKGLRPVPVGVPGELYIGGDGLARGYLRRPELTADRFIPNPFGAEPGARLYKTGDLVCYLADGSVVFIGRVDYQVKIRGFRIELEEIEAVLSRHPAVAAVAVQAREDVPGDRRLVAYLVSREHGTLTSGHLRGYLSERLPDYMVPSAFVMLDGLPLTANGKVDRRALPAPDDVDGGEELIYVGPRNPTEEVLAVLFADVLHRQQVGVHDNFFDLGGHSLLATQLISRVRDAFRIEIPLRSLFELPTVASFGEAVEQARADEEGFSAPPVVRAPRDATLPLSFAQQRLWFLHQLEPESAFYNVPAAVRLRGQLNVAGLEATLNEIVRRHEVLRTRFASIDGQPVQIVEKPGRVELPVIDLNGWPEAEREARALSMANDEFAQPFNLETGPMLRATLLRLSEDEHVLLFIMHHIVSDAWSLGVLIEEVSALYTAFAERRASPLPELEIQYADYAVWQREWLQGEVLDRQLAYWRQQLADAPPLLELPADRPRPAVQSFRGNILNMSLSESLTEELKALSRREGVTLFMTLLAAFQVLLARYTRQEDISVGTPIAGRNRSETEGLIGFFVNTLVLRTDLSGNPTAHEVLERIREVTLGAYAHQDLPFERLVEELQPERGMSHTPLFQVMFSLQNAPRGQVRTLPGLELSELEGESKTATFDLGWGMSEDNGVLRLCVEYSTDLFDETTVRRMTGHFVRLLESMSADPDRRVSDLALLSDDEQRRMLVEWNDTRAEYPHRACVHHLFEAQAARTPDAVAVVYEDQSLTYGEMNTRSNQLAHYLRELGVGPEVLVGLCVERSVEMVVGLLGILKAGGAYVPLDPEYPLDRLSFMLEDAGASVLVTQESLLDALPAHKARVVCLDEEWQGVERDNAENPTRVGGPDNLAYVIYTSGSTGRPKGVMVSHRSLVNYVDSVGDEWSINPSDRLLQFASLSFDASAEEIYSCLLKGATVVLRTPEMLATPSGFLAECRALRVTVLDLPVAYWHQLAMNTSAEEWAQVEDLRLMILGAEKVQPEAVRWWNATVDSRIQLYNCYGPTETTIVATMCELKSGAGGTREQEREIPIGRPVRNLQAYILDGHLQPVPVGVAGELHVGGIGLARGYLFRPDLTATKFIPDPFGQEPGGRLYKTGDLVRYQPDGQIEFLGRVDQQVKLRGFRIELGEIEAVLAQHEGVREVVVVVREDVPGDKRLVAYFTAAQAPPPGTGDLRRHIHEKLPEYMVPSHFVMLDRMPLTSSDKIDRRALPVPDQSRPELERAFVAPRTPIEEMLAGIWCGVLKLDRVGIYDNFFELGGHSLLAMQLISRVRVAFHVELPVRVFFSGASTVARLAEEIEELHLKQSSEEELADMLGDLEALSDEEVKALLAHESRLAQSTDSA